MNLEVCVSSIEDILITNRYNIKRIELNSALEVGGLTPSYSLFKKAKNLSNKDIIVMIRLREGSFCYTQNEIDIMYEDAKNLLEIGAKGIVFGFLKEDNSIDFKNTIKFISLAKNYSAEAIFHRAIDVSKEYFSNMEKLKEMGITRILTSGKEKNVDLGIENLKKALSLNLPIIIGSGINEKNISHLISLGFKDFHGSFSTKQEGIYPIDFGKKQNLCEQKLKNILKILL